jgi:hypothetical protein
MFMIKIIIFIKQYYNWIGFLLVQLWLWVQVFTSVSFRTAIVLGLVKAGTIMVVKICFHAVLYKMCLNPRRHVQICKSSLNIFIIYVLFKMFTYHSFFLKTLMLFFLQFFWVYFTVAQTIGCQMVGWLVNNEFKRIWKKIIMA